MVVDFNKPVVDFLGETEKLASGKTLTYAYLLKVRLGQETGDKYLSIYDLAEKLSTEGPVTITASEEELINDILKKLPACYAGAIKKMMLNASNEENK